LNPAAVQQILLGTQQ